MAPIILPSNQPQDRFYRGGERITSFRSIAPCGSHQPEDWIASTSCCLGTKGVGMTTLPNGKLLLDEIQGEPEKWLGTEHIKKFGVDTKLLVKLLDAGQRLPVHAHPSGKWAKAHIGHAHGKAEAWYILTPGVVYLGLKEDVSAETLLELVKAQDVDTLLDMTHKIEVEAHQTVYVPPGTLHAIGEGILLVEVQEPEDLSILLEWKGFAIDGVNEGHLGVGFETALTAVDKKGRSREEIMSLVTTKVDSGRVFAKESYEFFELERLLVVNETHCGRGFAILVVLEGSLDLISSDFEGLVLKKGNTVVIPFVDGDFTLQGKGEVLIARPP
jgi:mannose-6-phosphate isomerase